MISNTIIDDSKTTADRWKDWRIASFEQAGWGETFQEYSEVGVFTKQDFGKALKKVSHKVEKK